MKGPKGHWVTLSQPSNMLFKSHWAMGRWLICLYIVFQLHTVPLRNSHPSPIPSPPPPPIVCIKEGGAQPLKLEQYIRTAYEAVSLCYMTCNLLLSSLWVLKALDEACMLHQLSNKDLDASKMVIFRERKQEAPAASADTLATFPWLCNRQAEMIRVSARKTGKGTELELRLAQQEVGLHSWLESWLGSRLA